MFPNKMRVITNKYNNYTRLTISQPHRSTFSSNSINEVNSIPPLKTIYSINSKNSINSVVTPSTQSHNSKILLKRSINRNDKLDIDLSIKLKNKKVISFNKEIITSLVKSLTNNSIDNQSTTNQTLPNKNHFQSFHTKCNFLNCGINHLYTNTNDLINPNKNYLLLNEYFNIINKKNNQNNKKYYTSLTRKQANTPITYRSDNLLLKQMLTNPKISTINKNINNKNDNLNEGNKGNNNNDDTICTYSDREDDESDSKINCDNSNCNIVKKFNINDNKNYYYFTSRKPYNEYSINYEGSVSSFRNDNRTICCKRNNKVSVCGSKFMNSVNVNNDKKGKICISEYGNSGYFNERRNNIKTEVLPLITSNSIFSKGVHKRNKINLIIHNEFIKDKV